MNKNNPRKKLFLKAEVAPVLKEKVAQAVEARGFNNEAEYFRHLVRVDIQQWEKGKDKAA